MGRGPERLRALAALLALGCAHRPAPAGIEGGEGLTPGDHVVARWRDGLYPATVVRVRAGQVTVTWDGPPGAESQVQRTWVSATEPLSTNTAPGTWAACADGASYVLCQVVRVEQDEAATVRWPEEPAPRSVRRGQVVPLPAGLAAWAAEVGARHTVGEPLPAPTIYAREDQFPAGWLKSKDLAGLPEVSFDGLDEGQKAAVMQALNQRDCHCGCGMGSIAGCALKDPNCPRSPKLVRQAVALGRKGRGLGEILAAIDTENPGPQAKHDDRDEPPPARPIVIAAHSPRKGAPQAKVTIVVVSDFQCPFCQRAVATLDRIEQRYGKDVAFVFVNQPLPFHPRALPAAKAFMAAARQGKAWPMHDRLFAGAPALADEDLARYAEQAGLDVRRWRKDLADPALEKLIAQDQAWASSVGADGTPTFFLDGRQISGAQPFEVFQAMIDEELKKANVLLAGGTPPADLYAKLMADNVAAAPSPSRPSPTPPAEDVRVDIAAGDSPVKGPPSARVTIVAFSDFQCPFCGRVLPTLAEIERRYAGKVRFVFKNLPLSFHQHAALAAEAALAAHQQGKFWEFHDRLFAHQQELERPDLEKHAGALGLDLGRFRAALDGRTFRARVEEDARLAGRVGAQGTPTFFINGKKLVGARPLADFTAAIDAELAGARP